MSEIISGRLKQGFGGEYEYDAAQGLLKVDASRVGALAKFLRNDPALSFDYLRNLTAQDYPDGVFTVVYNLHSFATGLDLMVYALVPPSMEVESVTPIWPSADWQEREVYDMFGIVFTGHHDLRRILMDEDCNFFPLRKSFKLDLVHGLKDMKKSEEDKKNPKKAAAAKESDG
jgi:NADH-quinone oxidoreductase subunit C